MWTEGRTGGQTDRQKNDETNSRFSKFCQRTLKFSYLRNDINTPKLHANREYFKFADYFLPAYFVETDTNLYVAAVTEVTNQPCRPLAFGPAAAPRG